MPKKAESKKDNTSAEKVLTEEEKAKLVAEAEAKAAARLEAEKKAKAEAEAIKADKLSKITELTDYIKGSNGKFDSDYYGFAIDNMLSADLKLIFPPGVSSGNIVLVAKQQEKDAQNEKLTAPKKDTPAYIISASSPGLFAHCEYYRSFEDQIWNNPLGESVTFEDMHPSVRAVIKKKREEGVNILFVKLAELDNYGKKKKATTILEEEYKKRKANPELAPLRLGCQVFDKSRRLFIYLGNLELFMSETYEYKIPGKKETIELPVFYFVA